MWKAVLVLFMTSSTQPVSTMIGQFPDTFMKKDECQAFVAKTREDIAGTVTVFTKYADLGFKVLHHELSCIEDDGGEPA